MLSTLRIRNLALVEETALELPRGFLAITGETGAGKSILIGALNLLLGERADRNLIRAGAESGVVEGVFDLGERCGALSAFLAEQGLEACEDGQLVLRRTITGAGASRQFVNGSPTTVAVLARLGEWLVDIHGPHDHQSLLSASRQLAIVDALAGLEGARKALGALLEERARIERERASLLNGGTDHALEVDLLRHQVQEIENARLDPGRDAEVEQDFQRASHSARLLEELQVAMDCLDGDEHSLMARSRGLGRSLLEMKRLDPAAQGLVELHEQAASVWEELRAALGRYADRVEVDPERWRVLEERLNLLQGLKRKYGGTLEAVAAFGVEARRRLGRLERREEELNRLGEELAAVETRLRDAARRLSAARRRAIPALVTAVRRELADLGFRQGHFEVQFEEDTAEGALPTASGWDRMEFLFAPNPGEPPRPLRAIASSGEIARVMLALKTVLAAEDEVLLLVFDEVDANVGGETARVVGEKMRRIAERHQVICITHLAPVAALADGHCVVTKEVREGRSVSEVRWLAGRERVRELARMLGGQDGAALRHAEALMRRAGAGAGGRAAEESER